MGHAKDNGGIHGHSGLAATRSYIVFAISDDIAVNKAFMGWCSGIDMAIKPLLGCYKGKTETSYLTSYDNLQFILQSGWLKGQESILVLGTMDSRDRRKANLHYLTPMGDDLLPRSDDLGVMQSVSRAEALACNAWSYDPDQREYFICVDPNAVKICPIGLSAAIKLHCEQHDKPLGDNQDTEALIKTYLLARRTI